LEITRLRYFCAVAETESVRRAAELLHVSPGALSKALRQVEDLAGVALFARIGRTIALTDAGRRFHVRAANVIAEYTALGAQPRASRPEQPLRVGSFEVFTTHLLGHVISTAMKDEPVVAFELVPGTMEEAVRAGEVDFGLTYAPVVSPGIELLPLGELTMGLFGRASRWQKVPFADLVFAVPITPVGGHVAGLQSLDGWPAGAPPRTIRYRFELLESALVLARAGKAVLHAPSFVVKLCNRATTPSMRLSALPLPGRMKPVHARVHLVKRSSEPETAHIRAWARAIRRVLSE
jgi:DNA-binding transcriptional LysR family regulator